MSAADPAVVSLVNEETAKRRERLASLSGGGKVVAVLAAFSPPLEIVEASGCTAVRLVSGGTSADESRGLRYLKNEACSLLKGIQGSLSDRSSLPDAVVVGGACDQLRRSAELFHRDLGIPVFELAMPRVHAHPLAEARSRAELEWLAAELSSFAGRPAPGAAELNERISAWNRARACLRELAAARAAGRLGAAAASRLARSAWILGAEGFAELWAAVRGMLPAEESGGGSVRLLLAGPPVLEGDELLATVLDRTGKGVVCADLCETLTFPHQLDVAVEDDPLSALARSSNTFPLGCGFKRPDSGFLEALRKAAADSRAEGLILKGLSFCAPWNHQAARFASFAAMPSVTIEGDYSEGQEGRLRTRVEAFLESFLMGRP